MPSLPLAERLGDAADEIDRIPEQAIDSFARVRHFLDLAALKSGEAVLDLGSGSGMDSSPPRSRSGRKGGVVGVDITDHQLAKVKGRRADGRGGYTTAGSRAGPGVTRRN